MVFEKDLTSLVVLSFLLTLWWRAVWSLLDVLFGKLARGNQKLLIIFDVASIVFIIAVLFLQPGIRETFA